MSTVSQVAPRDSRYPGSIRLFEADVVLRLLPSGSVVLEVGGSTGLQAAHLRARGHVVHSFDVETSASTDVVIFDGVNIPLADGSVDVSFSSNTLEHVVALKELLTDTTRVVKDGGLHVHLLPTPTWRVASLVGFYVARLCSLVRVLRAMVERTPREQGPSAASKAISGSSLRRYLVPPAHGEFSSAMSEVVEYSKGHWKGRFMGCGLEVVDSFPAGLFYTGHGFAPNLGLETRRLLAKVLGSSSRVYLLRVR